MKRMNAHDNEMKMDDTDMAAMADGNMSGMDMHSMSGMDMDEMDMDGMPGMDDPGMKYMGNLKQKFWVSLGLMLIVVALAPLMGLSVNIGGLHLPITFPGSQWVLLIAATALFLYGGLPFIRGGIAEIRAHQPGMMALIGLGITVAYVYSVYAFVANNLLTGHAHLMNFFWELSTLIVIMLLGHWVEMNAVMKAGDATASLGQMLPDTVHMVHDGQVMDMPLADVQVGSQLRVLAGESIPADGQIDDGSTSINEALVSGESAPVSKTVGDQVTGGTVNGDGTITMTVTAVGDDGFIGQIGHMVSDAQQQKSRAENIASRVAGWLFYIALIVGLLTVAVWSPINGFGPALMMGVTVLIIACPHALGLALPLVIVRATGMSAKRGLLVRNRNAYEATSKAHYVMFDKTGTLTTGHFTVNAVQPLVDDMTANELLADFAALEQSSTHPFATGVMSAAKAQDVTVPAATDVQTIQGAGLQGTVDGHKLLIVNAKYLDEHDVDYAHNQVQQLAAAGNTVSLLVVDGQVQGMIAAGDVARPEAASAIKGLKAAGLVPVMLTGDNQQTADAVAQTLGIDDVHAELMPADKAQLIADYQQRGGVLMVGDGINDAPSLAGADVGIAIGAGTDVAIDAADVVLVSSKTTDILNFVRLAQATNRKLVQNIWWAAGYNIIAIPLAAGVLAPIGITMPAALGAVVMSLSAVIVAVNAMTLHAPHLE
ncbi:copper-translocating P-type ATPase [Lacticaseibacillus thailandensis]|nr:copper-translocating P-type ATPase [Lacticaseibacillus thailandensis]